MSYWDNFCCSRLKLLDIGMYAHMQLIFMNGKCSSCPGDRKCSGCPGDHKCSGCPGGRKGWKWYRIGF